MFEDHWGRVSIPARITRGIPRAALQPNSQKERGVRGQAPGVAASDLDSLRIGLAGLRMRGKLKDSQVRKLPFIICMQTMRLDLVTITVMRRVTSC